MMKTYKIKMCKRTGRKLPPSIAAKWLSVGHSLTSSTDRAILYPCRPTQLALVPVRASRWVLSWCPVAASLCWLGCRLHASKQSAAGQDMGFESLKNGSHMSSFRRYVKAVVLVMHAGEAGRRRPSHTYQAVMCDFTKSVSATHAACCVQSLPALLFCCPNRQLYLAIQVLANKR